MHGDLFEVHFTRVIDFKLFWPITKISEKSSSFCRTLQKAFSPAKEIVASKSLHLSCLGSLEEHQPLLHHFPGGTEGQRQSLQSPRTVMRGSRASDETVQSWWASVEWACSSVIKYIQRRKGTGSVQSLSI